MHDNGLRLKVFRVNRLIKAELTTVFVGFFLRRKALFLDACLVANVRIHIPFKGIGNGKLVPRIFNSVNNGLRHGQFFWRNERKANVFKQTQQTR